MGVRDKENGQSILQAGEVCIRNNIGRDKHEASRKQAAFMADGMKRCGRMIACRNQRRPHRKLTENGAQYFCCVRIGIAAFWGRMHLRVSDAHDLPSRLDQRYGKIFPKARPLLRMLQQHDRRIIGMPHEFALEG